MMDNSFTNELIYSIFNDFFLYYVRARDHNQSEENRNKSLEDMEAIIQMLLEETSNILINNNFLDVQGLSKMNVIDSTAPRYFYLGSLTLLLAFKINHFEKSEIISGVDSLIESVFTKLPYSRKFLPFSISNLLL